MWKRILALYQRGIGRENDLGDRLFRFLLLVGGCCAGVGVIETFIVAEGFGVVVPICFLLAAMLIMLLVYFQRETTDWVKDGIGLFLTVFFFPQSFFFNGALHGGAPVWMVMGMVFAFLVYRRWRLVFFVGLNVVVDILCYVITYLHPELVQEQPSKTIAQFDSVFSVLVVGIGIGIVIQFLTKIFTQERTVVMQQKDEMEKLSKSKEQFFASMSHELRTPLNSILGLNELIQRSDNLEEVQGYADNIELAGKMLLNLVNDILEFSQIEMQQMEIVPVKYSMKKMLLDVVDMMSVRMHEKGLAFQLEIDRELPSVVMGDERRIQQILLNILTNAVKYTKEGSVTLRITGERKAEDTIRLTISVADTGIGIKKEDLASLYDTFKRAKDIRTAKIEGSGLGLAITRQLVTLMGGEITVDSIYKKGSVFTVYLDQKIIDETGIGLVQSDRKTKGESSRRSYEASFQAPEARVLIVDDNSMNAMVAKQLLKGTKMQVDTANSGEACLEMTGKRLYHVILLDNRMNGIDGIETLRALRTQKNGLCRNSEIVLCTAESAQTAQRMVEEYGFFDYLEKPIVGNRLESVILHALPSDLIEQQADDVAASGEGEQSMVQKRKKICIATDCVADLPDDIIERYGIHVIYLYIRTRQGRYADNMEIDSDSLSQYKQGDKITARTDSATVEEFEEFFADMLTRSEEVIYLSMAKGMGITHDNAVQAAAGFDHVTIVDSGQMSSGQALVIMEAARCVQEGMNRAQVLERIAQVREQVVTNIIFPDLDAYYQGGYIGRFSWKLCDCFQFHPLLTMRKSRMVIVGLTTGRLEHAWKKFIRKILHKKGRICEKIVYITYVGCTTAERKLIEEEVLKWVPFEQVIFQKASFSAACNSGNKTISIAYYTYEK